MKRRKAYKLERRVFDLYAETLHALDVRGANRSLGDTLVSRCRLGEVFLLLADVLEEEGDFEFGEMKRLIEGKEHDRL